MKPFFFVLSWLFTMTAKAQLNYNRTSVIFIHYEKTPQGTYNFLCENNGLCPYTVTLNFPELFNLQSDIILPAVFEAYPGTHRILTLKNTGPGYSFRYSYSWAKGSPHTKADTSIPYLIPIAPGKETRIINLSWMATTYAGRSEPKDFYAIGFRMHDGDTVFASRRGCVIETRTNGIRIIKDSGVIFTRSVNYVEVLHDDDTFGRYELFRDTGIFVRTGDWVEAGQPHGIVGGEKYLDDVHIEFSVRYHFEQPVLDKDKQPTGETEYWAFVPMNFWVRGAGRLHLNKQTTYISEHPEDVVIREMSKKQARKWREAHPNIPMPGR